MARLGLRKWFTLGPLIWLAGLAFIICYAPTDCRVLQLADGEQVAAFLGKSHELVTMRGGPLPQFRASLGFGQTQKTINGLLATGRWITQKVPAANSVYLWDMDSGAKRKLDVNGFGPAYGVIACCDSSRLAIEFGIPGEGTSAEDRLRTKYTVRIVIVDAQNGKLVRVVHWEQSGISPGWRISNDGKKLAYNDRGTLCCADVDTGQLLYRRNDGGGGTISPDGQYLVISSGVGCTILNINDHRQIRTDTLVESISPRGDLFLDDLHVIRNVITNRFVGCARGNCVFVDGGKRIAWAESVAGESALVWWDTESHRRLDGSEIWLPGHDLSIETTDAEGNFIQLDAFSYREPDLMQKVMAWLEFKQASGARSHQWFLVDARSRVILHQGQDALVAVSSDGRYAVTGDENQSRVKVYDLPLRRSILFMAAAGAAWTVLCALVWQWRRRAALN